MGNYLTTKYQKKLFDNRYAQIMENGEKETKADQMFERVAKKVADKQSEAVGYDKESLAEVYYNLMADCYFIGGGRICANVGGTGTNMAGNCFVLPIGDSRRGIMKCQADTFETNALGGGTGTNYSPLRPRGAEVKGVRGESSGPCSFIEGFDGYAQTIKQGGSRRAARMTMLNVDHPDILEFIHAKQDLSRWQTTNISVGVTDKFMNAVENDEEWNLQFDGKVYETVQARDLWNEICKCAWNTGEPGVMFLDTLNRKYPLKYCRSIDCVNVCGELPLPAYGMCVLGSMILPTFVKKDKDGKLEFDWGEFRSKVYDATMFLDGIIDISTFPIPEIEETVKATRPIGLGITGLADALFLLGIPYGDNKECLEFCDKLGSVLYAEAKSVSEELAENLGTFPDYDKEQAEFEPRRNSTLIAYAPTGSVSGLAGCASYGIEPHYAPSVIRNEELGKDVVTGAIFEEYLDKGEFPEWARFVDGVDDKYKVTLQDHLSVLKTFASYVDSAISKTLNLPEEAIVEDVKKVFGYLWRNGIKGGTVYRNNCRDNQPVSVEGEDNPQNTEEGGYDLEVIDLIAEPREVPDEAEACRYKLKYNPEKPSLYITLTDDGDGPLEIFFSTLDAQTQEALDGLAVTLTTLFRRGIDCQHLIERYLKYESPTGGGWYNRKYVPSMLAGIGAVIRRHFEKMGYVSRDIYLDEIAEKNIENGKLHGERCPNCGEYAVVPMEGCAVCTSCGHSQCG